MKNNKTREKTGTKSYSVPAFFLCSSDNLYIMNLRIFDRKMNLERDKICLKAEKREEKDLW